MTATTPLMAGKKGLIMGLANDKSIAWGIAQALDAQGAQIAFSYQNEALEKRVKPLSETLSFEPTLIQCDVTDSAELPQYDAHFLLFFSGNLPLRRAGFKRGRRYCYPDLSGRRKNPAELQYYGRCQGRA